MPLAAGALIKQSQKNHKNLCKQMHFIKTRFIKAQSTVHLVLISLLELSLQICLAWRALGNNLQSCVWYLWKNTPSKLLE